MTEQKLTFSWPERPPAGRVLPPSSVWLTLPLPGPAWCWPAGCGGGGSQWTGLASSGALPQS